MGWRQEDLAKRARDHGLPWNRATVAALETGLRSLGDGELPLLAITPVADTARLLVGEGRVRLTKVATAELAAVRAIYSGSDVGAMTPAGFDVPVFRKAAETLAAGGRSGYGAAPR